MSGKPNRRCIVALAAALTAACAGAAAAETDAELFEQMYGPRFREADAGRDEAAKVELARQMLATVDALSERPTFRILLCEKAYDLTYAVAGDGLAVAGRAMSAAGAVDAAYAPAARQRMLNAWEWHFRRAARDNRREATDQMVVHYAEAADAEMAERRYEAANQYYRRALTLARSVTHPQADRLTELSRMSAAGVAATRKLEVIDKRLQVTPNNAALSRQAALLCATQLGDLEKAAAYADDADDAELAARVAEAGGDIESLQGEAAIALAEWCLAMADDGTDLSRPVLYRRAVRAYDAFLAGLGAEAGDVAAARARLGRDRVLALLKPYEQAESVVNPVREYEGQMFVVCDYEALVYVNGKLAATGRSLSTQPAAVTLHEGDVIAVRIYSYYGAKGMLLLFRSNDKRKTIVSRPKEWRVYTPAPDSVEWWKVEPKPTDPVCASENLMPSVGMNAVVKSQLGLDSAKGLIVWGGGQPYYSYVYYVVK